MKGYMQLKLNRQIDYANDYLSVDSIVIDTPNGEKTIEPMDLAHSRIDGTTIQIKMKNFEPESSFEDIKSLTKIKEIVFSIEESPSTAYDPIDTISVQKLVFDEYDASGAYESIDVPVNKIQSITIE